MPPVLFALKVKGCVPVKVLAFENVHRPALVEVNEFMLGFIATDELTVKGFAPAWLMPRRFAPMVPERVDNDVLEPRLVIVPVWF